MHFLGNFLGGAGHDLEVAVANGSKAIGDGLGNLFFHSLHGEICAKHVAGDLVGRGEFGFIHVVHDVYQVGDARSQCTIVRDALDGVGEGMSDLLLDVLAGVGDEDAGFGIRVRL